MIGAPYEEKMKHKPVECDSLYWGWLGWMCRDKEKRSTHLGQKCPVVDKRECLRRTR